jgi:colanic acid/amylovoran biosynthesis glycosyltransferase
VRQFLPLTETFIAESLRHLRQVRPVVVAGTVLPDSWHAWDDLEDLEARFGPGWRRVTRDLSRLKVLSPPAARALRAVIRERRIELVHAHFGDHAAYYAPAIPRAVPMVVSFYGYDATSFPRKGRGYGARVLRRLFRRGVLVLALSEDMRRDLIALGADPAQVEVHHLGVSLEQFPFTLREPHDELRLLFVGRLVEKKGIFDLLEAISDLPGVRCDVLGTGPLEAEARAAAGPGVHFHGAVPPREIPTAMAAADLLVAPSKVASSGDKEGMPTVIREAMASGLPVLATRHAGIPEMVEDGREGLLVAEGDPAALARAIRAAADSPERRAAWAAAAREKVEREFDAVTQAARLEALYARLLR